MAGERFSIKRPWTLKTHIYIIEMYKMVERREEIKDGAANKKGERRSEGGLFCNSKPGLMKVEKEKETHLARTQAVERLG